MKTTVEFYMRRALFDSECVGTALSIASQTHVVCQHISLYSQRKNISSKLLKDRNIALRIDL